MGQASEMCAAYGRAMAAAQALELTLSNTVEALKLDQGASFDPFAPLTLGQLIQALKRLQPIRSTLLAELAQALETRNWLAHGYFRRRNRAKLGHPEEIARLQRIESGFLRLSDEIGTIIRPYVHTNSRVGNTISIRMSLRSEAERDSAYYSSRGNRHPSLLSRGFRPAVLSLRTHEPAYRCSRSSNHCSLRCGICGETYP